MNFGVQTYTVRGVQKKSLKNAYLSLLELGITELEVARLEFSKKNAEVIAELVKEHGIRIRAIQVKPKYIFSSSAKIIDFCRRVGCKNAVISMLPFGCILGSDEKFFRFADSLDGAVEEYAAAGITLAYHHHNWEYVKTSSGKTRMAELLARSKKIKFVSDTYWSARSGASPERQIAEFGSRLLGLHLRDLDFKRRGIGVLAKDAAIGDGVIDFKAVLAAARETGCEYCVIEQNSPDPYHDIEKSLRNLEKIKSDLDLEE